MDKKTHWKDMGTPISKKENTKRQKEVIALQKEINELIKNKADVDLLTEKWEQYTFLHTTVDWGVVKQEPIQLTKQPRNYLKTVAKTVGRDTTPTLFPSIMEETPLIERTVISRNTAILGNYIFQLWESNGRRDLEIRNLSELCRIMNNVSNHEIKLYLLYLGGYMYPILDKDENGYITLTTEQLFKVTFRYNQDVGNKYDPTTTPTTGTSLSKFIKDESVDSILIVPNERFIKALDGKGLGNILVVKDEFIKLALSLSDMAYKLLSYTTSNTPEWTRSEDSLFNELDLDAQVKNQGRPRIRESILKALEELKKNGHISKYSYDEVKRTFKTTASNKFVKYKNSTDQIAEIKDPESSESKKIFDKMQEIYEKKYNENKPV